MHQLKMLFAIGLSIFITCLNLAHANQATAQVTTQTPQKLDVSTFTKLPHTTTVKISPDGKHIAAVFMREGKYMLGILRSDNLEITKVVRAHSGNFEIGRIYWANDTRVLYTTVANTKFDREKRHTGELWGVNLDGNKNRALMGYRTNRIGDSYKGLHGSYQIIDLIPQDKSNILVAFYPWRLGATYYQTSYTDKPKIYRLNVYTAQLKQLTLLPTPLASAVTDNNHEVRISYAFDDNYHLALHHKKPNQETWQELKLKGLPKARRVTPIMFAKDNNRLYLIVENNQGPQSLYLYDLTTHKAEKVFQHKTVDIEHLVHTRSREQIIALATEDGRPQYHILEHKHPLAEAHKQLLQLLQGYNITITSWSESSQKAVVFVHADYEPGQYYTYNHKTGDLNFVLSAHPQINSELMASKAPIKVESRDGITLHGYLTRPMGKINSLPTVVLVHGGPHGTKDSWAFDWQSQLLANHGYAVLQLNYRGSSGYGYGFEKLGHGQWGATMQDDLTDATKYLIEQGIADKNRICIFGESYGGYSALMGVVREPNLYQCAIGSMGVYSLPMLFEKQFQTISASNLSYLAKVLGTDQAKLKQYSPAYNTSKITAPLLLIHGATDRRAPIEHLKLLEENLKTNHKSYEKLVIRNEGHGIYDEENRAEVYGRVLKFLNKHIGN